MVDYIQLLTKFMFVQQNIYRSSFLPFPQRFMFVYLKYFGSRLLSSINSLLRCLLSCSFQRLALTSVLPPIHPIQTCLPRIDTKPSRGTYGAHISSQPAMTGINDCILQCRLPEAFAGCWCSASLSLLYFSGDF